MFAGKRAVVTGASKGIGLALSARLAQLGCQVTLVARNELQLKENTNSLLTHHKQQHSYVAADLLALANDPELACREKVESAIKEASILVNCAGATTNTLLARSKELGMKETIGLNLFVPILLSKMAIMPFVAQKKKDPCILNIGSILSVTGFTCPGTSVYAALKAGIVGFTQSLAAETKGKLRVNAVLPSLVLETDMGKSARVPGFPIITLESVVDEAVNVLADLLKSGSTVVLDDVGKYDISKHRYNQ